jgi:hypothetical protein
MRFVAAGALVGVIFAFSSGFAARAADPDYEMFLGFALIAGVAVGLVAGASCWAAVAFAGAVARALFRKPRPWAERSIRAVVAAIVAGVWMVPLIAESNGALHSVATAAVAVAVSVVLVLLPKWQLQAEGPRGSPPRTRSSG